MTDHPSIKPNKRPLIPLWMLRPATGRIIRMVLLIVTAWFCFDKSADFFLLRLPDHKWANAFIYAWLVSIASYEFMRWGIFKVRIE